MDDDNNLTACASAGWLAADGANNPYSPSTHEGLAWKLGKNTKKSKAVTPFKVLLIDGVVRKVLPQPYELDDL